MRASSSSLLSSGIFLPSLRQSGCRVPPGARASRCQRHQRRKFKPNRISIADSIANPTQTPRPVRRHYGRAAPASCSDFGHAVKLPDCLKHSVIVGFSGFLSASVRSDASEPNRARGLARSLFHRPERRVLADRSVLAVSVSLTARCAEARLRLQVAKQQKGDPRTARSYVPARWHHAPATEHRAGSSRSAGTALEVPLVQLPDWGTGFTA